MSYPETMPNAGEIYKWQHQRLRDVFKGPYYVLRRGDRKYIAGRYASYDTINLSTGEIENVSFCKNLAEQKDCEWAWDLVHISAL